MQIKWEHGAWLPSPDTDIDKVKTAAHESASIFHTCTY